jgi:hypothetical protein
MASLSSSMRKHPCHHCDGIVAVDAQASLLSLQWRLLPLLQWHLCRNQASIVIKLVLLPSYQWGHCHHQCAGIFTIGKLALSSL